MTYTYTYPRASVTVDMAVFSKTGKGWSVLLIQRGNPPFQDGWALPGGFIEMDETLVESAHRELVEETGLSGIELEQFMTYGDPGRDPRGRTVSVVFFGFADSSNTMVAGGDDAKSAAWYCLDNLPQLAFDHKEILQQLIQKLNDDKLLP